jgi:hypothetical protein
MYRILIDGASARAFGVCAQCKREALAGIWSEQKDGYQTTPPSGWTTFLVGRVQKLLCGSHPAEHGTALDVQACRPEDRAMLQTPAGRELLSAVKTALTEQTR